VKIDVLFIKANNQKKVFQALSEGFSGIEPPMWLVLTAAYLREKGLSVAVVDAEAENLSIVETISRIKEVNPLLASVVVSGTNPSASTINMPVAGEVLKEIKDKLPDVYSVISGLHPSALPEQTVKEIAADFIIVGEGFTTHHELICALKAGKSRDDILEIGGLWYKQDEKIVSNPRAENIQNLGSLPMPAWDLLPMEKYRAHNWHCFSHIGERRPYAVIYTSLGCPFKCEFCCINALFGKPGIRYRSPERVVEEIEYLVKVHGVQNIKVLDELFISRWSHVEAICDGIIEKRLGDKLNFWVYGRIDSVKEHMLEKMKKAGINWIAYGIEAGSKKVRDGVSKGRFETEEVRRVVDMTHKAGIHIVSNFIFGLPDDDFETMQETLDLAKELNCAYANFYCAMAYPGSKLYENAVESGVPLPSSWSAYSQFSKDSLPLPTKHLLSGQVLKFRDDAFNDYYNDPKYLDMVLKNFDERTVDNIKEMCSVKLIRNNYEQNNDVLFEHK